MLDHRASAVSPLAESLPGGKAGRLPGGPGARTGSLNDVSFGDVFTEILSDRRPVSADRRDRSAEPAETRPVSPKRQAQRKKAADRREGSPCADQAPPSQDRPVQDRGGPQPVEKPAELPEDRAAGEPVDGVQAPVPGQDTPQGPGVPVGGAATVGGGDAGAQPAPMTKAVVTVQASLQVAAAMPAATTVGADVAQGDAGTGTDGDVAGGPQKPSPPGAATLRSLQWLARQQVDRLSVKPVSSQPATASADPPVDAEPAAAGVQAADAVTTESKGQAGKTAGPPSFQAEPAVPGKAPAARSAGEATAEQLVRSLSAEAEALLPDREPTVEAGVKATCGHAASASGTRS